MLKVGANERPREIAEETAMTDYIDVTGTPYCLEFEASLGAARKRLGDLADRVELLRSNGTLSPATLQAYYGEKRFEQIAESNALEGSTLDVGDTELAVARGVTFTGHDPAYVRDAQALAEALDRLTELARGNEPTSLDCRSGTTRIVSRLADPAGR